MIDARAGEETNLNNPFNRKANDPHTRRKKGALSSFKKNVFPVRLSPGFFIINKECNYYFFKDIILKIVFSVWNNY